MAEDAGQDVAEQIADMLQIEGLDIDKNAVQKIENGQRFVTNIELKVTVCVLHVRYEELLDDVQ